MSEARGATGSQATASSTVKATATATASSRVTATATLLAGGEGSEGER